MTSWLFRGALAAVVLLVVGASGANASTLCASGPDTVSYCANIFATEITQQEAPWSQSVSLPVFNQAAFSTPGHVAELASVVVTLDWNMTGDLDVYNVDYYELPATPTHTFDNGVASVPLKVTGPGLAVHATAMTGPIASATSTPTTESQNSVPITPHYGDPVPGYLGESTYQGLMGSGTSSSSPLSLAAYQSFGPGTLTLTAAATSLNAGGLGGIYSGTELNGSGTLAFSGKANVGGAVEITYDYDYYAQPIPEPVTLLTVGSALIAVGLIFRRKLKRA